LGLVNQYTFDWETHKKNIYDNIANSVGEEKAKVFIERYSQRYDHIKKPLIDWRLAYSLMDDYNYCKRVGTRWFAFVGTGGTGKSTLLKNVFYWLDDRFQPDDLTLEVDSFIKKLGDMDRFNKMRALAMDEPDDDIHPQTEKGKLFRKTLGKARQGRYFFGICATDLTDIPPYIYRKIDVIIFTPYLTKGMIFKNKPKQKSYLVQQIRKEYQEKGYKVFFELQSAEGCLNFFTKKNTAWSIEEEEIYVKTKKSDFHDGIKQLIDLIDNKGKPKLSAERSLIKEKVMKAFAKGNSAISVKKMFGLGSDTLAKYKKEYNERLSERMRDSIKVNKENFVFDDSLTPEGGINIKLSDRKKLVLPKRDGQS